jgi:hypothetical protein
MAELTSFKQAVATDIGELKGLIYQLLGHCGDISAKSHRILPILVFLNSLILNTNNAPFGQQTLQAQVPTKNQ